MAVCVVCQSATTPQPWFRELTRKNSDESYYQTQNEYYSPVSVFSCIFLVPNDRFAQRLRIWYWTFCTFLHQCIKEFLARHSMFFRLFFLGRNSILFFSRVTFCNYVFAKVMTDYAGLTFTFVHAKIEYYMSFHVQCHDNVT